MAKQSSADLPKPVGLALVLCDTVYVEQVGGAKRALVGLFDRISARRFPAVHHKLCVFVSLTEVRPGTTCRLDIVHAETDKPVVNLSGPMPLSEPIQIWELVFTLHDLEFPEPGIYYVRLFGNDQIVLQRPISVVLMDGEPKNEPHKAAE